jgi:hypothetical protein
MKSKGIVALGTLALAAGAFLAVPTASVAAPPLPIEQPGINPLNPTQPITAGAFGNDLSGQNGDRQPMPSPSPSPMTSGSPMASPMASPAAKR